MFKRALLAITFIAAFGAAGLGYSSNAVARHGCYNDYGYSGYGYSYPAYYSTYYAPRVSYYRSYPTFYRSYGHGHHHHHHDHDRGLRISFGF